MTTLVRCLFVAVALTCAPPISRAQDQCGCDAALTKDLIITESARSHSEDFLQIIDCSQSASDAEGSPFGPVSWCDVKECANFCVV